MTEAQDPDGGDSDGNSGCTTIFHDDESLGLSADFVPRNNKIVQYRDGMYNSFDRKVEAVRGKFGTALAAREFIPAGAVIWVQRSHMNPNVHLLFKTRTEILAMTEEQRENFLAFAWQDTDELFAGNQSLESVYNDALNYFNHSCDPNCWFDDDNHISARRDIQYGDELCIDYAMCDTTWVAIRHCECGAQTCRGRVAALDYQRPDLRKTYGTHWREYIVKKIEAEEKAAKKKQEKLEKKGEQPTTEEASQSSSTTSSSETVTQPKPVLVIQSDETTVVNTPSSTNRDMPQGRISA